MNQHLARAQVEISKNGGREKQWEDWDFLLLSLRLFFQRLLLWLLCKIKRREWDGNWELKTYLTDEGSFAKYWSMKWIFYEDSATQWFINIYIYVGTICELFSTWHKQKISFSLAAIYQAFSLNQRNLVSTTANPNSSIEKLIDFIL